MEKIICFLNGIWQSLLHQLNGGEHAISGHLFVDKEYHKGCDVIISRCETCNKLDITWQGGQEVSNLEDLTYTK